MQRLICCLLLTVLASLAASGCGSSSASAPGAVSTASAEQFRLTSEPTGALQVLEAKDQAQDGQAVVIVGRVGGGVKPWIDGRAAFLLVDSRVLPSCHAGDHCESGCPSCNKEMMKAATMVKFCDAEGKVLAVDARTLLGVQEEQTVVIDGVASRDPLGNVSIAAKGIYLRK